MTVKIKKFRSVILSRDLASLCSFLTKYLSLLEMELPNQRHYVGVTPETQLSLLSRESIMVKFKVSVVYAGNSYQDPIQ